MNWLLLNSGKSTAAFNMALDEALLENAARIGAPVLRFYGWTESAATFGYFQKFSEVERATPLRPLLRRPTGGGIVPHNADWTYSAIFPPGHEWPSLPAEESYRRIHDWLRLAFVRLKIEAELAAAKKSEIRNPKSEKPAACFIGHEKSDLLWHGKKIAGAAQRRNKLGLLIQGSVQSPSGEMARSDWERAMVAVAAEQFGVHWQIGEADDQLLAAAHQLAACKYSQTNYNQKR